MGVFSESKAQVNIVCVTTSYVVLGRLDFLIVQKKTKAVCAFYFIVEPGSVRLLDSSVTATRTFAEQVRISTIQIKIQFCFSSAS